VTTENSVPAGTAKNAGFREKTSALSFTAFVLSLSTAALQHLGEILPGMESEKPCRNLELARQTIDLLEMLQKKTDGNLSDEEGKLLGNVLFDLRMRYVKAARESGCQDADNPTGKPE